MNPTNTLTASMQTAVAGKYLTFALGTESYGMPVLKVREIIKLVAITAVPQLPPEIKGVVNLRGKIVPVIDLRTKFHLAVTEDTERTCIVVVQVATQRVTNLLMGLVVDGVEEVANIAAGDIEETPDFGTAVDTSSILAMAKIRNQVVALLDIDRVVGGDVLQRAAALT